jgi:hypothetical protein
MTKRRWLASKKERWMAFLKRDLGLGQPSIYPEYRCRDCGFSFVRNIRAILDEAVVAVN